MPRSPYLRSEAPIWPLGVHTASSGLDSAWEGLPARGLQHLVGDERIVLAFQAEGGDLVVPWNEGHIVAQRPELTGDRGDQVLEVAARKVGPPDGASEQHIADLSEAALAMEEDHVSRRVAGTVVDFELRLSQAHPVTVAEPAVRHERTGFRHPPARGALADVVDPELVVRVRSFDGNTGGVLDRRSRAGMVEVTVSDPDLLKRQTLVLHDLQQARRLAAGVDHRRLAGLRAPDDGAVLL